MPTFSATRFKTASSMTFTELWGEGEADSWSKSFTVWVFCPYVVFFGGEVVIDLTYSVIFSSLMSELLFSTKDSLAASYS
jgi:hypothetical protein